jgi:hypothetical protein
MIGISRYKSRKISSFYFLLALIFVFSITPTVFAQSLTPATNQNNATPDDAAAGEAESLRTGPAITKDEALEQARAHKGRPDPFAPLPTPKRFPATGAASEIEAKGEQSASVKHSRFGKVPPIPTLVPPPPPGTASMPVDSIPVNELPLPPDRPSLANKLKLTGVVGNRAFFHLTDNELIMREKLPRDITLAPGEQFQNVKLISVGADFATLSEDGEQIVKNLPAIK